MLGKSMKTVESNEQIGQLLSRVKTNFRKLIKNFIALLLTIEHLYCQNELSKKVKTMSFQHVSEMPFGELPVLEVDGKLLSQSVALTRYLARKFNLAGKDEWESAQCDALIDGWEDFFHLALPVMLESDAEKRKSLAEEFQKKHFEPFLERYEKFLVNNGGNYFVGNQVTWVDLQMYHYLQILQIYFPSVFESHKKILDFMKKIEEIPSIKKWVETRPKTEH